MHSKLLEKHGLSNYITGDKYNMNPKLIGDKVNDDIKAIIDEMGKKPMSVFAGVQVHGHNVHYCNPEDYPETFINTIDDTDGLITDVENVALIVKFADCTPVVLFDPVKKVQAVVHSGWRGTVQRISKIALDKMVNDFGCQIKDIIAYVGPSIDIDNYEVGPEVYEAFKDFKTRDKFFKPHGEKYLLSMSGSNIEILLENGIKEENIEVSQESTFNNKSLHSARRDKEGYKLNSMVTII